MDQHSKDAPRTASLRPLTDDERQVLLQWIRAAKNFSAFFSERQSDGPALHHRIVICRRTTQQPLYLIHASAASTSWIVSTVQGDYVERFPTLRSALHHFEPVNPPAWAYEPPGIDRNPITQRMRPPKRGSAAKRLGILGWACIIAATLLIMRWLGGGSAFENGSRNAEAIAEQVVQESLPNPDSTQFRNVMAYRAGFDNERWVCGWFSTKYGSAALVGPRRFVVHVILPDHHAAEQSVSTHLLKSETEVPSMSVRLGKLLPLIARRHCPSHWLPALAWPSIAPKTSRGVCHGDRRRRGRVPLRGY